ncbi:MAG: DUF2500 domain-containing protein [Oscillospiraceae bacterium]|jgi:hypothetical protein|nr:DUF2500 domain-containing protein [Oscillospiraceae bacterium]
MLISLAITPEVSAPVSETEVYVANILIAIVVLIAAAWFVTRLLRREFTDISSPTVSEEASVLSKRKSVVRGKSVTSPSYCNAEFKLSDGTILEFRVPRGDYEKFEPDDFGTLTFKGTRFVGFERK